jgi:hypothetical protein
MDWADNQGTKKSITYILKKPELSMIYWKDLEVLLALLQREQISKERLRPSENIKFYLQNTGLASSITC